MDRMCVNNNNDSDSKDYSKIWIYSFISWMNMLAHLCTRSLVLILLEIRQQIQIKVLQETADKDTVVKTHNDM